MTQKKVKRFGNAGFISMGANVYTFEFASAQKMAQPSYLPFYTTIRSKIPVKIAGFDIIPYGETNRYPDELRVILDENNLTPEILNKQAQLLWGQGPALYEVTYEDGKRLKRFVSDPVIESWLKTWDYEDYLLKATIDFRTTNGHFTKFVRNLGPRIGEPGKIVRLEHVSCANSRLEWPDENNNINHIIVGDYDNPWKLGLKPFPVWNYRNPFALPVSMRYSNLHSFALDNDYSRAPFHGSLNWLRLSSSLAKLLTNFNTNSAAIKYHITIPNAYWETIEEKLRNDCATRQVVYADSLMEKAKDDILTKFAETLSGQDNMGKFVQTTDVFDDESGKYVGWKIDVLDQKVKDFIDAQINVSKRAALETSAGLGLHPALSNISYEGNLPSGSEQLYAFKLYLATGVDIPEMIICKDINDVIAVNFPGTRLRLGFYHDVVLTEEKTNPENRVKNAV